MKESLKSLQHQCCLVKPRSNVRTSSLCTISYPKNSKSFRLLTLTLPVHSAVGVLQEVVVLYKVLQYVLGRVHVLFGIHRRIFLLGAIEPAPSPDQIADIVEVPLVLVVAPAREIAVLRRHQLEINPLRPETPRAVPAGKVDGAAHGPLYQDVARFVLVLTEPGQGVVFAAAKFDTIAVVDLLKHPHGAARHHLQSAELLPEEPVQ